MYYGVFWEPGRPEHFLPKMGRIGSTGLSSPGVGGTGSPACNKPSGRHKMRETREGITYRQREEVRRMFGSLCWICSKNELLTTEQEFCRKNDIYFSSAWQVEQIMQQLRGSSASG
jgi:hypothetical protein